MPVPKVIPRNNGDGTFSSELTRSFQDARLNGGRETLIPTLIEGVQYSDEEALQMAIDSGLEYPSFDSPEEATEFAHRRTKTGGATVHGFLGKERQVAKKKVGIRERASRQVAFDTAGDEPSRITTLKRGIAMMGALVTSAFAPGDTKTDSEIKEKRSTDRKASAAKKAQSKKDAMKRGEGVRRGAEKATPGDPAGNLRKIAEAAKKK